MSSLLINHNGSLHTAEGAVLLAANRGYRYSMALFETMYYSSASIRFATSHFERMFDGIKHLRFNAPAHWNAEYFSAQIHELLNANQLDHARVRLSIYAGNGNLGDFESPAEFLIETSALQSKSVKAIRLGLYSEDFKTAGKFANLKSAAYLLNSMATQFAITQNFDDALLLNHHGRVCESTISNVFWIKEGNIYTIPLSEGPVAGVMRRHLIDTLPSLGYRVETMPLEPKMLLEADEIFLTNAIQEIRSVAEFQGRQFSTNITEKIYSALFTTNS